MKLQSVFAFIATALVAVNASAIAASAIPAWLQLRAGQEVFTGTDGGDAAAVSVCTSAKAEQDNDLAHCTQRAPGIAVHVLSAVLDPTLPSTFSVRIAADRERWSGYVNSSGLQAKLPRLVVLTNRFNREQLNPTKAGLDNESGLKVETNTKLGLLLQDASNWPNDTIYVQVLSGPHAGLKGWTIPSGLSTSDGVPLLLKAP